MREMMMRTLCAMAACTLLALTAQAQVRRTQDRQVGEDFDGTATERDNGYIQDGDGTTWGRDSTKHKKSKPIPIGQFQWVLEPRLGTVIDAENNDTVVHNFQNWNNTDGYRGNYSYLGNIGSPRFNRLYMERERTTSCYLNHSATSGAD